MPPAKSAPITTTTMMETSKKPQVSHTTGAAFSPAPLRYCNGAACAAASRADIKDMIAANSVRNEDPARNHSGNAGYYISIPQTALRNRNGNSDRQCSHLRVITPQKSVRRICIAFTAMSSPGLDREQRMSHPYHIVRM
jgi:hypothetical protein